MERMFYHGFNRVWWRSLSEVIKETGRFPLWLAGFVMGFSITAIMRFLGFTQGIIEMALISDGIFVVALLVYWSLQALRRTVGTIPNAHAHRLDISKPEGETDGVG